MGSKGQNRFLSKTGHAAYEIKENDTYNNMQEIILSLQAPYTPRVGSEGHFFLKEVMLHIKLKEMKHTISCKQIVCPYTHSRPLSGVERSNISFLLIDVTMHIQ